MLGSNPGLLQLWHWQPGALHHSARSHPHCIVAMIPLPSQLLLSFLDRKRRQKFFFLSQTTMSLYCPLAMLFATILVSFRPHFSSARWVCMCTWPNRYPLAQSCCAPSTIPESDVIYSFFHQEPIVIKDSPQGIGWEGAEQLLNQLAAFAQIMNIFPPPQVLFLEKTPNPLYVETAESNRVAMTTLWRTFHHDGKISPGWWGWGCMPTPFHSNYIQSCSVRSCWESRYTHPISSLPPYVLCGRNGTLILSLLYTIIPSLLSRDSDPLNP